MATIKESHQKFDTFYNDPPIGMTYARRIARYLSQFNWYFPNPTVENTEENTEENTDEFLEDRGTAPNLDAAWAHFEHIGLPRCFKARDKNGRLNRAEPGEIDQSEGETMLYPVWKTALVDMGDFGVGVGLYFSTLQLFALMAFVAGLINIPAMVYFNSDDYSPDGRQGIANVLKNSAVCTQSDWKPCLSCEKSDWTARFPSYSLDRFAESSRGDTFIKVNDCQLDDMFGISTYISLIFVILAIYGINYLQTKKAVKFDVAQQTSTDYSIKIMNPPLTATDPELWKEFFKAKFNANVDVCTIALDNELLIKALVHRRILLTTLRNMLPLGIEFNLDDLDETANKCPVVPTWKQMLCFAKTPSHIVMNIRKRDQEILGYAKNPNFKVARAFVTFDTEKNQRKVIKKLAVAWTKRKEVPENERYEGTVLRVVEPDEPVSIRWIDLSDTHWHQIKRKFFTMIISLVLIVGVFFIIGWAENSGPQFVATIIIVQSYATPMLVRYLCSFESHPDESSLAASKYLKITIFRWVSTVIIPLLLVSFSNILDSDAIIQNIQVLLVAEIIQRPILQLIGIFGILYRHILGPRAVDQRRMNLMFAGDTYNIGERYTDITRIFFLTVFYCILYPMAFFFASAVFAIYYWVDKFCILRSWKQGPTIGTAVSNLSMFFFELCLVTYAIMAAYLYSEFPYDNACPYDEDSVDESYFQSGSYNVTLLSNKETTIEIRGGAEVYTFCNQETIRSLVFPPLPTIQTDGKWMTESQEKFSYIFGWTAVVVLTIVLATFVYKLYRAYIYPLFFKSYKFSGKVQGKPFEEVKEIAAYVPQVRVPGFAFPFLLCDNSEIDQDHIGWRDPHDEDDYAGHNLINDVKWILRTYNEEETDDEAMDSVIDSLFSSVRSFVIEDSESEDE